MTENEKNFHAINVYDDDAIKIIEARWRARWLKEKTFRTSDPVPGDKTFYCLDMFPYPSGDGLHVGHPVGFIASDIISRYKRMRGFNVLHPMGWDAFGLPAERHAMKTGQHPSDTVRKNAANYRRQMELIGLSYDWDRELSTTDPKYYKITQSMFLDLYQAWFDPKTQRARHIDTLSIPEAIAAEGKSAIEAFRDKHRLAYYSEAMVNFCPELGTVVANEEVMADGRTEQGYEVVRQKQRQMMMRISSFAERLLAGLEELDWPQSIKEMQRNWIGRSEGHRITFSTEKGQDISVFTTRADTLPGVTFLALAPDHPLVSTLTTAAREAEVRTYVEAALQKSDLARKQGAEKSGIDTGARARNPLTGAEVPIFVADYVLVEAGTGAVMGVPAHDQRDYDFAALKELPIIPVIAPEGPERDLVAAGMKVWAEDGTALPNDLPAYRELGLAGMPSSDFARLLCNHLEEEGKAEKVVQYRIRDWIFSRQRYWGEPIPLIHWEDGSVEPIDRSALPLVLPPLEDYRPRPDGEPPLARATEWVNVIDTATGRKGTRETLTMPQWAGSCWYPLRFMQPDNLERPVDPELEEAWGPVDLYIGGAEHATLHLLYARFWYLALSDLGTIGTAEPFRKLINQGLLLSSAFRNSRGVLIPADEVEERVDEQFYVQKNSAHFDPETADIPLERTKTKMSKSLRNVVTPDDVIESYGADSYRVGLMFMGPVEQMREWEDGKAAAAAQRFLRRYWRFMTNDSAKLRETVSIAEESPSVSRLVDETVTNIGYGIEKLRLNTAIAAMMKCLNEIGEKQISQQSLEKLILAFSPFAPFVCEELWERLGYDKSLARAAWPKIDLAKHASPDTVKLAVTVNGKRRCEIEMPAESDDDALTEASIAAVAERWDVERNNSRAIVVRDKATHRPKLVNIVKG